MEKTEKWDKQRGGKWEREREREREHCTSST